MMHPSVHRFSSNKRTTGFHLRTESDSHAKLIAGPEQITKENHNILPGPQSIGVSVIIH